VSDSCPIWCICGGFNELGSYMKCRGTVNCFRDNYMRISNEFIENPGLIDFLLNWKKVH